MCIFPSPICCVVIKGWHTWDFLKSITMKTKYPSPWKVTVTFFFTSQNKRYTARYKYQLPFWQLLAVQMGIVLNSQRIPKQSNYLNRKLINKKNELFSPHRISWSRNHWTAAVGAKKQNKTKKTKLCFRSSFS